MSRTCEEVEFARKYARRGHSFSFTAQLLGMTNKRLRRLLEEEGVDIQFVPGMCSLGTQRRLEELHESNRGKFTTPSPAVLAALARGRETRGCVRYTAFGVTGYLSELKEHFNCSIQVKSIRARIASGMSVEEALTRPVKKPKKGLYPPQFYDWLIKRRTIASARVMLIVRNRLRPTMVQYQKPEHDIVVVAQTVGHIAVEVRSRTGDVIQRLRFIKSFDSGVLFVFNPEEQNRMDFIAFEPESPHILCSWEYST